MIKITDFTLDELIGLYHNCTYHLGNSKLTVPQRQEILKDQGEIYYAMEMKIPDHHLNQIHNMKAEQQDRYFEKVNSIDARYLAKLKEMESAHNRERIKDLIIAIGLAVVVITLAITIAWFAPEIDAFIQTQYSK